MALRKANVGEVPPGAVVLSENEALNRQWRLIMNWSPESDVWPFRAGVGILSAASALSGIYINSYYRNKLHLGNYGRFSTYLPIVVLPTIVTTITHQQFISKDILLEKTPCPVCIELRSGALQVAFSTVYPTILAPLSGFMFATRHFTYKLPPISQPLEQIKLWRKLTRPIGNILFTVSLLQAFVAMCVTYFESDSYMKVQTKLLEIERECEL